MTFFENAEELSDADLVRHLSNALTRAMTIINKFDDEPEGFVPTSIALDLSKELIGAIGQIASMRPSVKVELEELTHFNLAMTCTIGQILQMATEGKQTAEESLVFIHDHMKQHLERDITEEEYKIVLDHSAEALAEFKEMNSAMGNVRQGLMGMMQRMFSEDVDFEDKPKNGPTHH